MKRYPVAGRTARRLVNAMRFHPFPGHGSLGLAGLRASQDLRIVTTDEGTRCRAEAVELRVRFVMTLPQAVDESEMNPALRSAWAGFLDFARRHEEGHRTIALQCARRFEAVAIGMTSEAGCQALAAKLAEQLEILNAFCQERHLRYDRRERARLDALPLMRAARQMRGARLHLRRS